MKFFQTKAFKKLEAEWRQKLKDDGFDDIERLGGELRKNNPRLISFAPPARQVLAEFFRSLEHFLTNTKGIPRRDRKILSLYVKGNKPKQIREITGLSDSTVRGTFRAYRRKLLGGSG
jgi:DNA-binding NarL/FixJ family response regulator